jgi:hypothetical protein
MIATVGVPPNVSEVQGQPLAVTLIDATLAGHHRP